MTWWNVPPEKDTPAVAQRKRELATLERLYPGGTFCRVSHLQDTLRAAGYRTLERVRTAEGPKWRAEYRIGGGVTWYRESKVGGADPWCVLEA